MFDKKVIKLTVSLIYISYTHACISCQINNINRKFIAHLNIDFVVNKDLIIGKILSTHPKPKITYASGPCITIGLQFRVSHYGYVPTDALKHTFE